MKFETITAYSVNPFSLILCNSQIFLCFPDSGKIFIRTSMYSSPNYIKLELLKLVVGITLTQVL